MAALEFRRSFLERGYSVVPGALDAAQVRAFVAQLSEGSGGVRLSDDSTWPRGNARRVVEVAPVGGAHWGALASSPPLVAALDALLGRGDWELPLNQGNTSGGLQGYRHWYAPITFPEGSAVAGYSAGGAVTNEEVARDAECMRHAQSDGSVAATPPPCEAPARACAFCTCASLLAARGSSTAATSTPASAWHPCSRRRWAGLGWHLDTCGSANDAPRLPEGLARQGVVLLVLLSDCAPGGGGTALLPRSHAWVHAELRARAAAGVPPRSHEDANLWAVAALRAAAEAGRVLLPNCACGAPQDDAHCHATCTPLLVEQVSGAAGDVVLMHPLLLHSGTTNCSANAVRLMLNGSAHIRGEAFVARGAELLRDLVPRV